MCVVGTCTSCTRGSEDAFSILAHAAAMVGVGGDLIFFTEIDLGEGSVS